MELAAPYLTSHRTRSSDYSIPQGITIPAFHVYPPLKTVSSLRARTIFICVTHDWHSARLPNWTEGHKLSLSQWHILLTFPWAHCLTSEYLESACDSLAPTVYGSSCWDGDAARMWRGSGPLRNSNQNREPRFPDWEQKWIKSRIRLCGSDPKHHQREMRCHHAPRNKDGHRHYTLSFFTFSPAMSLGYLPGIHQPPKPSPDMPRYPYMGPIVWSC